MPLSKQREEELNKIAQDITDLFFASGARITKTHYAFILDKIRLAVSSALEEERERVIKGAGDK